MNDSDSTPPRHVPILTEVIDWPDATQLPAPALAPAPAPLLAFSSKLAAMTFSPAIAPAAITLVMLPALAVNATPAALNT